MVIAAGVGHADPGSTMQARIARDRSSGQFIGDLDFDYSDTFRSSAFKSSPPKSGISDLKGAREQQDRAYRDKEDSDARIVFEMPYTGK